MSPYRLKIDQDNWDKQVSQLKLQLEKNGLSFSYLEVSNFHAQTLGFESYCQLKELWQAEKEIKYPTEIILEKISFQEFFKLTLHYNYFNFTTNQAVWAQDIKFQRITQDETSADKLYELIFLLAAEEDIFEKLDKKNEVNFISFLDVEKNIHKFLVTIKKKENTDLIITLKRKPLINLKLHELIQAPHFLNHFSQIPRGIILVAGLAESCKNTLETALLENYIENGQKVISFEQGLEYSLDKKSQVTQIDISQIPNPLNTIDTYLRFSKARLISLPEIHTPHDLWELGVFKQRNQIVMSKMILPRVSQVLTKLLSQLPENNQRGLLLDLLCHLKIIVSCRHFSYEKTQEKCILYEALKIDGELIDDILNTEKINYYNFEQVLLAHTQKQKLSYADYANDLYEQGHISESFFIEIKKQLKIK